MMIEAKPVTKNDILTRIDAITGDHAYLKEAFDAIEKIQASGQDAETVKARVFAVESIARQREETNRKILGLLETMLDSAAQTPAQTEPK